MGIVIFCDLCVSTSVTVPGSQHPALESDARTAIRGHAANQNQFFELVDEFFEAVAGVDEVVELDEVEFVSELDELVAGAELSEGFEVSPPDFASLLPFAAAGFAEE